MRWDMTIRCWYYLHINGDLICKPEYEGAREDILESTMAVAMWPIDTAYRACAWTLLVEALAAGAKRSRIDELAARWECTNADALLYAQNTLGGAVLELDGDMWRASRSDFRDLAVSPAGFGATCLEALADLAKALGFKASKLNFYTFVDLMTADVSARGYDPGDELTEGA